MTDNHPIAPPPELVRQWRHEDTDEVVTPVRWFHIACTKAARWGADQELQACCEWLEAKGWILPEFSCELRTTRRPKPPSLKEQGIALIDKIQSNQEMWQTDDLDIVRRALESLPD